jgi:ribonuclease VapC
MILDSSAVAAVCLGEPTAEVFSLALETTDQIRMSAATYLEAAVVLDRRAPGTFDRFVTGLGIEIVAVDQAQADIARDAYRLFGRGSGHPAGLNFGDCFAYALAAATGEALLYQGEDFSHTDVTPAVPTA